MATRPGRQALLEQLVADGFTHMFGNPGTVEQGFLDALEGFPDLRYILTLQETIAVMTADGYARASGRPALVQIHSTPGLGNAIGALYQAKRGHAPLVVIGGDAGIRYQAMDAQMAGDLVAMAEPVTKWATMVQHPASLLRVLRRAVKIAATPPMGPVYVCLPEDVLDQPVDDPVVPTLIPSTRVVPDAGTIQEAARLLAAAERPTIFVGDGIAWSGAQGALTALAERLGATVWEADAGEVNISRAHPLYGGMTGHMFGSHSLPILQRGDVNLICGTYVVPEVYPKLDAVFAPGAKVIHFDLNGYEIAKNHPVDLAAICDPRDTLSLLVNGLDEAMTDAQKTTAASRLQAATTARAARDEQERATDAQRRDAMPLAFSRFMAELAERLPDDAVIFDEALTSSPDVARYCTPTEPGRYFLTRGGSLGVGIPGAIGAKIANPDATVIGFTGDGGGMYTIQALWTAVRHGLDAKFVISNNRSYRLLQLNIMQFWAERSMDAHAFPLAFDLSKPAIRFDQMAESMGALGLRVETPDQIAPALDQALAHPGPVLLDVQVAGDVHPEMIGVRCGQ